MKKILGVLLALVFLVGTMGISFAQSAAPTVNSVMPEKKQEADSSASKLKATKKTKEKKTKVKKTKKKKILKTKKKKNAALSNATKD